MDISNIAKFTLMDGEFLPDVSFIEGKNCSDCGVFQTYALGFTVMGVCKKCRDNEKEWIK